MYVFLILYLWITSFKSVVLYDVLFRTGGVGSTYAISHWAGGDKYYYLISLQFFWEVFSAAANSIYVLALRDSAATLTIDKPLTKYYAQNLLGLGTPGAELDWAHLYGIFNHNYRETLIATDDINGLLATKGDMSLMQRYTCFWDFLADFYKESLTKVALIPDKLWVLPMFENTGALTIELNKLGSIKPKLQSPDLISRKVTSSLLEKTGDDLDSHEAISNDTRNKGDNCLPIIFNNLPAASPYTKTLKHFSNENDYHLSDPFWGPMGDEESKVHYTNLYQNLAAADSGGMLSYMMPVKVSEICKTYLGQSKYNLDYSYGIFDKSEWADWNKATELCKGIQSSTGKPLLHAEAMIALLKNRTLSSIEIEILMNEYIMLPDAGPLNWHWWFCENICFEIDLTGYNADLNHIPKLWFATKKKIDDVAEKASLTLISNPL